MGAIECCKANNVKLDIQPYEINQPALVSREITILQQFMEKHQNIKKILEDEEVKQMGDQLSTKDQFLKRSKQQKFGNGTFLGSFYIEKNSKNGMGIMMYDNGTYYEGFWLNGLRNGKGVLASQSGEYYCGEWNEDLPHGQGTYSTMKPYYYYKGTWSNGLKHGKGQEQSHDGCKYIGQFVDGEKQGHGKLLYPDRTQYDGQFKNGNFDGIGYYKGKSHHYQGNWKQGKMHGQGKSQWYNQNSQLIAKYLGQYNKGIKEGYGEYTDSKGALYRAMWINGEMNQLAPIDVEKPL